MHLILSSSAESRYRGSGIKLRVGRRGTAAWKSHFRDKTSPSIVSVPSLHPFSPYLLTLVPLSSSLRPRFQPTPLSLNPNPTHFSAVTTIPYHLPFDIFLPCMVGRGSWVVCIQFSIVPDSYKLNITYITGNMGWEEGYVRL